MLQQEKCAFRLIDASTNWTDPVTPRPTGIASAIIALRGFVAYQSTKAGLVGLAHGTMEEERKHGIRTTVIFPGLTDTPLVEKRPTPTPPDVLARALQPEDIAAACLFVLRLPPRAWAPELLLYPSHL